MNEFANGRFEMDVKIIDERGRLVATSKHACLALPRTGGKAKSGKGIAMM